MIGLLLSDLVISGGVFNSLFESLNRLFFFLLDFFVSKVLVRLFMILFWIFSLRLFEPNSRSVRIRQCGKLFLVELRG